MSDPNLTTLTADIVGSFIEQNKVSLEALPDLITSVYASLATIQNGPAAGAEVDAKAKPTAAQIRKSVQPDYLISFVDGKRYKSLKRHLSGNGYKVEQYREEFGLPNDYPMVSPNYSKARSDMARSMGLGHGGRKKLPAPIPKPAAKRGPRAQT